MDGGVWYHIWMVHNMLDRSFQVYAQGGSDLPEKTLLTHEYLRIGEDEVEQVVFEGNSADYRVDSSSPLDWFMIRYSSVEEATEAGFQYVNVYIDDIAIDSVGIEVPAVEPKLINISTRALVGSGNDVMVGGFYVDGDKPCLLYTSDAADE